jgi:hypothetical protein
MAEYDEFIEEDYPFIKKALEKGFTMELVMGPLNEERKHLLKDLLEKYPDKFKCFVSPDRLVHHFSIIEIEETVPPSRLWKIAPLIEWLFGIKIKRPLPRTRAATNLLIEYPHPADRPYDKALGIKRAYPAIAQVFDQRFDEAAQKAVRVTLENLASFQ